MLNPAVAPQNELNAFTQEVKTRADNVSWGKMWVELRNGDLIRPKFSPAQNDTCEDSFVYYDELGGMWLWNLDGTSVTNSKYDMCELVEHVEE